MAASLASLLSPGSKADISTGAMRSSRIAASALMAAVRVSPRQAASISAGTADGSPILPKARAQASLPSQYSSCISRPSMSTGTDAESPDFPNAGMIQAHNPVLSLKSLLKASIKGFTDLLSPEAHNFLMPSARSWSLEDRESDSAFSNSHSCLHCFSITSMPIETI